jgi:hypothetical protein
MQGHYHHIVYRLTFSLWLQPTACSVLPRITSRMPAVKLYVTSWNLPRDLQLADPGFNIPGDTDMLIGAEVYLDLLRDGFRKRKSNFPIMQNTALG